MPQCHEASLHGYQAMYSSRRGPAIQEAFAIVSWCAVLEKERQGRSSFHRLPTPRTEGDKVLDLGFGDARNTMFLIEKGYEVSGTEITEEIVNLSKERLKT